MINSLAIFFEEFAKKLGLEIKLPRPGKHLLNFSFGLNLSIGLALIASGIAFSKKMLAFLGSVGILSALFLAREKDNVND